MRLLRSAISWRENKKAVGADRSALKSTWKSPTIAVAYPDKKALMLIPVSAGGLSAFIKSCRHNIKSTSSEKQRGRWRKIITMPLGHQSKQPLRLQLRSAYANMDSHTCKVCVEATLLQFLSRVSILDPIAADIVSDLVLKSAAMYWSRCNLHN